MRQKVNIDNTRFIFTTNFSGDPTRDRFGSDKRRFNIVIPTAQQAQELFEKGVNVKATRFNPDYDVEGEWEPTYFVPVNVNMDTQWPPHVYWITPDGNRISCDKDIIGQLDYIRVRNVMCQANLVEKRNTPGEYTLYADVLYVEQAENPDPYWEHYSHSSSEGKVSDADQQVPDLPF